MKQIKIIFITIISINAMANAQMAIGKPTTAPDAILDFGTDDNKGIVLPYITALDAATVPGTFYYDTKTSKVKVRLNNKVDKDLSIKAVQPGKEFNTKVEGYASLTEVSSLNGTVIGSDATNVPGVLILDSKTKVMVLPSVKIFSNVGAPAPGTIVYDSTKKLLCVYDGEKWAFWGRKRAITQ